MREENTKTKCDVVVVGTAYAGLSAALEASEAGANVIALGRQNILACNSAIGGGSFTMADTSLQREKGIHDSAELLAEDILRANRHTIAEDEVWVVAQESTRLYDWLTSLGAEFFEVVQPFGHSVPRVHTESGLTGGNVLRLLYNEAIRKGVDIRLGTVAEHLIVNDRNEVEGVQAVKEGQRIDIRAKKAVIIAAGGFAKNPSMMDKYLPHLADWPCYSAAGSTGDGIRMGIEVGADLHNIDAAGVTSIGCVKRAFRILGLPHAIRMGAILINKNGQRFVDESQGHIVATIPLLQQPDSMALLVMDDKIVQGVEKFRRYVDKYARMGLLHYGDTPSELASAAGIECSPSFQETVTQFFPSGKLCGTWVRPGLYQTMGGLKVNAKFQVIHRQGYPIPHLYAAGDSTPSLGGGATPECPGPGMLIGISYLLALASGRIAARNAAREEG